MRTLAANANSDAISITVISQICKFAAATNNSSVAIEAVTCLAAISETENGVEKLASKEIAATMVDVALRMKSDSAVSSLLLRSLLAVSMASVEGICSIGEAGAVAVASSAIRRQLRSSNFNDKEAENALVLLCGLARVPNGPQWLLDGGAIEPIIGTVFISDNIAQGPMMAIALREAALTALATSASHFGFSRAVLAVRADIVVALLSLIESSVDISPSSSVPVLAADILVAFVEQRLVSGADLAEAGGASALTALLSVSPQVTNGSPMFA
jgi:hypothetical protein